MGITFQWCPLLIKITHHIIKMLLDSHESLTPHLVDHLLAHLESNNMEVQTLTSPTEEVFVDK